MKLVRFGHSGATRPGVVIDGGLLLDVSDRVEEYDRTFFESDGVGQLRSWVDAGYVGGQVIDCAVRLAPPVATRDASVYVAGVHQERELVSMNRLDSGVEFFGGEDPLVYGENARVDFESVSVACVLGCDPLGQGSCDVRDLLAGCMVMSCFRIVSAEGVRRCCGFGPEFVTSDELGKHPLSGDFSRCWSRHNKHHRLVAWFAEIGLCMRTVLEGVLESEDAQVGDVIAISSNLCGKGRSSARLPLKCGDLLECGVDGLGVMRHRVVAA